MYSTKHPLLYHLPNLKLDNRVPSPLASHIPQSLETLAKQARVPPDTTHVCLVSHVSEDEWNCNHVHEADRCRLSVPAEVLVAVDVHVCAPLECHLSSTRALGHGSAYCCTSSTPGPLRGLHRERQYWNNQLDTLEDVRVLWWPAMVTGLTLAAISLVMVVVCRRCRQATEARTR
jgi:hypothetical protein